MGWTAETRAAYTEKNREKLNQQAREWRAKNREKDREWHRAYYQANKEKRLENNRKWCLANPEKKRLSDRRTKGLPDPTRPAPSCCECCGRTQERHLELDHCHETGKFRGWLCIQCNTGIGKLGDNVEALERAIAYLKGELPFPS